MSCFNFCTAYTSGDNTNCFYTILGVSRKATYEEIKKAYFELAKQHHPDSASAENQDSDEKFKRIANAYDILKDPIRRQIYDQDRRNEEQYVQNVQQGGNRQRQYYQQQQGYDKQQQQYYGQGQNRQYGGSRRQVRNVILKNDEVSVEQNLNKKKHPVVYQQQLQSSAWAVEARTKMYEEERKLKPFRIEVQDIKEYNTKHKNIHKLKNHKKNKDQLEYHLQKADIKIFKSKNTF